MRTLDEIRAIAEARKGGSANLEKLIGSGDYPARDPKKMTDDRWLSIFSRHVFAAGFNWKAIDRKWPGFEEAFKGFDVGACAMMDDAWMDALLKDTRIVRNGAKIASVRDNAAFLQELAVERGSAAATIADWPDGDYVGLLDALKRRGSRLGGSAAQYALRQGGKSGFILSPDVVGRLVAEGVVDKAPTSRKDMAAVQNAFDGWQSQSGLSLAEISRVLALSIDA